MTGQAKTETREALIFAAVSDLSGKTRGKGFPAGELKMRLQQGVGWAPANAQTNCFDRIAAQPYGSRGEVLLMPQPETEVRVDFQDGLPAEHFILCDIQTLEGEPWGSCARSILKGALARLQRLAGAQLQAAFEHEFQVKAPGESQGAACCPTARQDGRRPAPGESYGLQGFARGRLLGETLAWALRQAGLQPDSFLREYGSEQYEFTIKALQGVAVADAAATARELARLTALHLGQEITFTPIQDVQGVGNGVHIHLSLLGPDGKPLAYDSEGPFGLSELAGSFAAGVLKYLDGILAFTAPSAISYQRLTPHRWSVAYNNLGFADREAALRIVPTRQQSPEQAAEQFNLEYRATDAAASPHLALAAIVHAGAQGIEEALPTPPVSQEDLSLLSPKELARRGYARNPQSLKEALARTQANATVCGWFPKDFLPLYAAHKEAELAYLEGKSVAEQCYAYAQTY